MDKPATTDYEIHELLRQRWSPRSFTDRSLSEGELRRLFEAVRWAPSCFNEQPWRFIVARREEGGVFARILQSLAPGNQSWAAGAAALVIGVTRTTYSHNGQPNSWAAHDLGLGLGFLAIQATAQGLGVHMMAGFDPDAARREFEIPADFDAITALAIGYPGPPDALPSELREKELAPRVRRAQAEFVFGETWGKGL